MWLLVCLLLVQQTAGPVYALDSCFGDVVKICATERANFTSANVACKSSGGGLINIQNSEQLSLVTETIKKSKSIGSPLWIGLYYAGDSYRWISGVQAVTYTNFPSNLTRKECFTLTVNDANQPPVWSSAPCSVQNHYVCGTTNISKQAPSPAVPSGFTCPKGFEWFEGTCYMLTDGPVQSCPQAKQACIARNGVLASIPSMILNDYLSVRTANWSHPAWIGLKRELGTARWQDNSSVTYTNWLSGYPWVNHEVSSCTLLRTDASHLGRWQEVPDSRATGYICEAKPVKNANVTSSGSTDSLLTHQGCGSPAYSFQNRCYDILKASAVGTFSSICPNHTMPQSPMEWAFTRLVLSRRAGEIGGEQSVWTGVNMSAESAPTTVTDALRLRLHLPGNTSSLYTPTAIDFGHLSFTPSTSHCLMYNLTTAVFFWTGCVPQMPTLCVSALVSNSAHQSPPSTGTAGRGNTCPPGWTLWNASTPKCLSPMNTTQVTWFEAHDTCRGASPSGELVSLHSPEDYWFLAKSSNNTPVWLGLRVQLLSGDRVSRLLHWSDSSPVDYLAPQLVNRDSVVARHGEDIEQCVDSVWKTSNCYKTYPFFCQRDVGLTVPDQPPVDTTRQVCSRTSPSACFELHTLPAPFWAAASQCHRLGRVLAMVTTREHQELVQQLVRQSGDPTNRRAYIGLFSESGTLSWTSGSSALPVTFWNSTSTHSSEECIFIDPSASPKSDDLSTWQTGQCHVPLPFICSTIDQNASDSSQHESTVIQLPDSYKCPTGFVQAGLNCFSVRAGVNDLYTWSEAADHCSRVGGTLVSVLSQHDQDVLMALLGLQSRSAWIGLRYANNSYTWSRPDPVNFTVLADENSLLLSSACVSMLINPLGEWRGSRCSLHMGYICETKPVRSEGSSRNETSVSLLQQGGCRSGYHAYRDQCFAVFRAPGSHLKSFDMARQLCSGSRNIAACDPKANPGKWATVDCPVVATPHARSDAAYLRYLIRQLGGNSLSTWAGVSLNVTPGKEQISSEDGHPLATGLLDFSKYQDLAAVAHSRVTSRLCTIFAGSITGIDLVTCDDGGAQAVVCSYYQYHHPAHPSKTPSCPEGWRLAGGKCYLSFGETVKMSWQDAEQACRNEVSKLSSKIGAGAERLVGHLPSLHTPEEIEQFLPSPDWTAEMWTGLRASYGAISGGSGLRNHSIHMSWSDNSFIDHIPIHPSDLDVKNGYSGEKCIQFSAAMEHSFHLADCNKLNQFQCQLSLASDGHCTSNAYSHKVQLASSYTCYHMAMPKLSWSEANAACRGLNPPGNLVSFHSQQELTGLLDLLIEFGDRNTDVWLGLYESRFAYRWSDASLTDHIPMEIDERKANRHLVQDCFVLSPNQDIDELHYFTWRAVNCSEHKAAVVCQPDRVTQPDGQPVPVPTSPRSDAAPTRLPCPSGFSAFLDRCFMVLNESLSWADADRRCSALAGDGQSAWSGSLARIDNHKVQEFLSSLLDNLPATSSAAWIGLVRNLTDDRSSYRWSDAGNVSYLRPTFSLGKMPIFDQQFAARHSLQLCMSLSRSPYPRINGLWLPMSCDTQHFPSICQAQPRTAAVRVDPTSPSPSGCPRGFILAPTGQVEHSSLSRPVCYYLLDNQPYDWESSQKACWQLSTPEHSVTGLILASVYEANFLRAWLSLNSSAGGAGLKNDSNLVWTALQIPSACPACHTNWSWATGRQLGEPVRFIDWWASPSINASGCYVFDRDPYSRLEATGLGSLQPSSCAATHPVICQTPARLPTETPGHSQYLYQLPRPSCSLDVLAAGTHPQGSGRMVPQMTSQSGKPCLRWDMVIHEILSDFPLDADFQRRSMAASDEVGGHGMRTYAENYCSSVYNASTKLYSYGCYVSINPVIFEACGAIPCSHEATLGNGHILSSWLAVILLLLLILGSLVLCISLWKGCNPVKTASYRQMLGSASKRNSTVFFTPEIPAATILAGGADAQRASVNRVSYSAFPDGHSSQAVSLKVGGPRHLASEKHGDTVNYEQRSSSVHMPLMKTAFLNSMAFYNPAYVPLKSPSPDDLYDIDEEM